MKRKTEQKALEELNPKLMRAVAIGGLLSYATIILSAVIAAYDVWAS